MFPSGRTVEVQPDESVWVAARRAGLPIAASCDGDGVCGKCRVLIMNGAEHCSAPTEMERQQTDLAPGERLACQLRVTGQVHMRVTYW